MPEIVSDEFREGYAAFQEHNVDNPYNHDRFPMQNQDWEAGYIAAYLDWCELIGEKSV